MLFMEKEKNKGLCMVPLSVILYQFTFSSIVGVEGAGEVGAVLLVDIFKDMISAKDMSSSSSLL